MVVGDVNNDGRADLLIEPENSWDKYIYLNLPPNSEDCDGDGIANECDPGSCGNIAGDIDGDGDVDASDQSMFVSVMIGTDTDAVHISRCDLNADLSTDGRDVPPFVAVMLEP
jgi:hypothetical protein